MKATLWRVTRGWHRQGLFFQIYRLLLAAEYSQSVVTASMPQAPLLKNIIMTIILGQRNLLASSYLVGTQEQFLFLLFGLIIYQKDAMEFEELRQNLVWKSTNKFDVFLLSASSDRFYKFTIFLNVGSPNGLPLFDHLRSVFHF